MQPTSFSEVIESIAAKDARYECEAYDFLREALDFTQKVAERPKQGEVRHVSGQELLDGFRDYALQQFGPMAWMVLDEWGVRRCEDVGEIVFNMIEAGLLAKTDQDRREDFAGRFDFHEVFQKPVLPCGVAVRGQVAAREPGSN